MSRRAILCCTGFFVFCGLPAIAQQREARKQDELKWAKGVAIDFLAAMTAGQLEQAEMLLAAELRKRVPMVPWLLDARFDGLGKSYTITEEQIAPDRDEASFKGVLQGEKREAPFSLRVVREKSSGLWRVNYFRYDELRDIAPKRPAR
jgi:hypothetical protein